MKTKYRERVNDTKGLVIVASQGPRKLSDLVQLTLSMMVLLVSIAYVYNLDSLIK